MDYNATTPLEAEVVQTITEALQEAWGNPSSTYPAGMQTLHPLTMGSFKLIIFTVIIWVLL